MTEDRQVWIVRCGEVALKGTNKPYFEKVLASRIRLSLKDFHHVSVVRSEGLIFVRAPKDHPTDQISASIARVFGVDSVSPAMEIDSELDAIGAAAVALMMEQIDRQGVRTFKVEAKRADKRFPIPSPEVERIIGAKILVGCKVLSVNVHQPDCKLYVDIRQDRSYVFVERVAGFGGLPRGTNGKGLSLLSGGIDSPVATFLMAKRGMIMDAVHFHSYPYTSERAQEKVLDLARILTIYCGPIQVHSVNLLPIQQEILLHCPENEVTILTRRFMMKIAERIAVLTGCQMLITGENMGQVASQTVDSLVATDQAVQLPVMRPLIAMEKQDIINIARKIGTFEISVKPFEDCCTVFLPRHPVTRPQLWEILQSETLLDVETLVNLAVESRETQTISGEDL